jgi:hypothetical protein
MHYYLWIPFQVFTSACPGRFRIGRPVTNGEEQQAHLLIPGHLTDLERVLGLLASVKVLAASISSTYSKCAHFGSRIIGSRKLGFSGGYNVPLDTNPFNSWATVLDCGDIPVTS